LRHLIEEHLEQIGSRRSLHLTVMAVAWLSIGVGVLVWALGWGLFEIVWLTWEVRTGSAAAIAVALLAWLFIGATVPLMRAGRDVWRAWRNERWEANASIDRLESAVCSDAESTRHLDSPRERLAMHGLAEIERRWLGRATHDTDAVEPRVAKLPRRDRGAPPADPAE
jgi:hypothetical protein